MPRPIRTTPSPSQLQRAQPLEAAIREVEREYARRRLAFAARHTHSAKGGENKNQLETLHAGAKVLIYRPGMKRWDGPYIFVSCAGETVVDQTRRFQNIFSSTCDKPYTPVGPNAGADEPQNWIATDEISDVTISATTKRVLLSKDTTSCDKPNPLTSTKKEEPAMSRESKLRLAQEYADARRVELKGLLENGTFEPVDSRTLPRDTQVFRSRFVDEVKRTEARFRRKSRLVAHNYHDHGATLIATKAPTVNRFSQRVLRSVAISHPDMHVFTRDITQAYIQSNSKLERKVYIRAPAEMGLPDTHVLEVQKPLYGIPESGRHWYCTYRDHHINKLGMICDPVDPCVLIKRTGRFEGAVALQVDDSLGACTEEFLVAEEQAAQSFKTKARTIVGKQTFIFNGSTFERPSADIINMTQTDKINNLIVASEQFGFNSRRAAAEYIGVNTRPDICTTVQVVAPGSTPSLPEDIKTLKRVIELLQSTSHVGLSFRPLDMATLRLTVFTDAGFANARGLKSKLGFIITMADATCRANIFHFASTQCRRVTRSVMDAELHALVLGFDQAYSIQDTLRTMLNKTVPIELFVDSKTVVDVVAKDATTIETILQIDIAATRESYEKGELARIAWIPGGINPADALKKIHTTQHTPIWDLMTRNYIEPRPTKWASLSTPPDRHHMTPLPNTTHTRMTLRPGRNAKNTPIHQPRHGCRHDTHTLSEYRQHFESTLEIQITDLGPYPAATHTTRNRTLLDTAELLCTDITITHSKRNVELRHVVHH